MASTKLSGQGKQLSPGNGRNVWDADQRLCLHFLHAEFEYSLEARTAIFNSVFKEHQQRCGVRGGLSKRTLDAQYRERKKPGRVWEVILQPPKTPAEAARRSELNARIKAVARSLSLNDESCATPAEPTKTIRRLASVLIPRGCIGHPSTSQPKHRGQKLKQGSTTLSPRSSRATVPYFLPIGQKMMLTPEEIARSLHALTPPLDEQSYPPLGGLLFRYWDNSSQVQLNNNGFKAGRFATVDETRFPLPACPDFNNFFWIDLAIHVNFHEIATPFISVSNAFYWILRRGIQEAEKGATSGKISLIDASALDRKSILYLPPFHKELRKKFPFDNGKQRYMGSHEFLVFHRIPAYAVVSTFHLQDMLDLAATIPATLRFDILRQQGDYRTKIWPMLRGLQIEVSVAATFAIAKICKFIGLTPSSPIEQISSPIEHIVYGFALHILEAPSEEGVSNWRELAGFFASTFCKDVKPCPSVAAVQRVKIAFLDGVRWAQGGFNPRHSAESIRKMQKKASKIGLSDPVKMILDELDDIKAEIRMYKDRQERLINSRVDDTVMEDAVAGKDAVFEIDDDGMAF